jgi:ATP-binding cassette, subfamily B, bacterial PglK
MNLRPRRFNRARLAAVDDPSIATATRRMLELMTPAERRRLWWLTPVLTLNALMQVIGIASVMPFMALIASPDSIQQQPLLRWMYALFPFGSDVAFMVFIGLLVLVALIVSNGFAALTQMLVLRYSWDMNHTLSVRMLRTYLYKPYAYFLNQNTAGLAKNILGEVRQTVSGFLVAGMNLAARVVVSVSVMLLLIVVEPLLALGTSVTLGGAYGIVYLWVRRGMSESGRRRTVADRDRFKAATEALTGVKEIKVLGKEQPFLHRYFRPSRSYAQNMVRQNVISMLPRYAFESIAFGGMMIIVLYLLVRGDGLAGLLPTLGVYAFASYRLLPSLQGIFVSLTDMRYSIASVEVLHADLEHEASTLPPDRDLVEPLPFRRSLELRDVTFGYPGAREAVFQNFDLRLEPNTTVALVGPTGSGKTTLVDLLLGLLRPQSGQLLIDGVAVDDDTVGAWQKSIGYVPQQIYLADDSVAANIAFGVPVDKIDLPAVERAARLASIHDFIVEELPHGYETEVGERGVRLSGGQRQRLGIARALFHDPAVLILDEATSALDTVTEEGIFHAVKEIGRSKTVVMIAHRISTVREADVIFLLDHGRVLDHGTYAELLARSPAFRALARVDAGPLQAVT